MCARMEDALRASTVLEYNMWRGGLLRQEERVGRTTGARRHHSILCPGYDIQSAPRRETLRVSYM